MAKGQQKIRVVAMVRVGEKLVDVDTLSEAQRVKLANAIRCTLFNAVHVGVAEAVPAGRGKTDSHVAALLRMTGDPGAEAVPAGRGSGLRTSEARPYGDDPGAEVIV
jgi:hypothetical protein